MTLPRVKFTKSELKTARAMLKEIVSSKFDPLYAEDKVKVEIVDKAAEVIINWEMPNWAHHYWTKFSSLSEDAQGAARGLQANYFNTADSEEYFSVSTTHDLDSWKFSKSAIDSLAAHLLKKAFNNNAGNIERYESCRESAGRKYRASHKKLAEKVFKMDGKIYVANTYIYKNGALRHSDKEFDTAVAAYNYLHKKMMNYAGTTDATQTIESYDGVTSTEIYYNDISGNRPEMTTNAEIQKLMDAYDAEIDARIAARVEIENAKPVVTVDLSTTQGSMSASEELWKAYVKVLEDKKFSCHDVALVKIAYEMVDDFARCDKAGDELVAEGKISAESQAYGFIDGQLCGAYKISDNSNRLQILDLMYFAKVTEREYYVEYRDNLINDFGFNRNAAAKAAIYALNLAGVKATGKTDYTEKEYNLEMIDCIDEYATDAELAAEVEIENAKAADIKEIKREIKYTRKNIFIRKMEGLELEGGIETLKKLNRLCEKEFNARLQRKENLRDLVDIAEKIGDNLETIKRREERIAGIRRGIEVEEEELAELENRLVKIVTPVQEESLSVEKIFLKVADDLGIKVTDKGKYVFDIYDNDRCQHVCKRFKTLKDAVQISRIMHRELCKVSRHIEASVEVLTMDINSLCMRADDWTLLYKIDNYGKEYVMRRETVEVIAELDKRTVEEVKKDVCIDAEDIDNLGVYRNSALESAEKKSLDWQSVSTKQKEFKKAYLQGNLQVATELFETLKIIYRAYVENRAA